MKLAEHRAFLASLTLLVLTSAAVAACDVGWKEGEHRGPPYCGQGGDNADYLTVQEISSLPCVGGYKALSAKLTTCNAGQAIVGRDVTLETAFISSNPNIVVCEEALCRSVAVGSATVSARWNGLLYSTTMTVIDCDAGTNADTGSEAGEGQCNELTNDAPTVTTEYLSDPMPNPQGGTIVEGVYERTRWVNYATATGPIVTSKTLISFHGGTADYVTSLDGKADQHFNATYVTEGTGLTLTLSCGGTVKSQYDAFDATATTIVFYDRTGKSALSYTKR